MCMSFYLNVFPRTLCEPRAHRGEKRALDPLGLELQIVVSHHVVAGNRA